MVFRKEAPKAPKGWSIACLYTTHTAWQSSLKTARTLWRGNFSLQIWDGLLMGVKSWTYAVWTHRHQICVRCAGSAPPADNSPKYLWSESRSWITEWLFAGGCLCVCVRKSKESRVVVGWSLDGQCWTEDMCCGRAAGCNAAALTHETFILGELFIISAFCLCFKIHIDVNMA